MNTRDHTLLVGASSKAVREGQGTAVRRAGNHAQARAARQRKLHVGHFAFMRSVVQGLDPRESWQRYLRVEGEAGDQRTVRATIAWIREEFAAAAKRQDRFGTARLVRIDATRIPDLALDLPSLEAFAEAHGLEDERQADQIAAFQAEYGRATQRARRRARLITRQLEALRWLEGLVAQSPKPGDSVAAWLHPTLAGHLEAADIFTLAQLVERINGVGRRWYAGIKSMGQGKAQRIVEWLQDLANSPEHSTSLQLGRHVAVARSKLYAHELQAVVAPATAIRPLEKFIVPAEVPVPIGVVGELSRYLVSRGLAEDPEDIGNQGAHLLGKASDAAELAPGLSTGQSIDPRQGIAATTFYDQIKAFFTDCADVLRGQGDSKGAEPFAKASTHWMRGTRTRATRSPAACRSRSRSRTSATRRWPPRRSTSPPKSAAA
jgi:hypothetical protein